VSSRSQSLGLFIAWLLVISLPGCGGGDEDAPQRAAVEGSVSFDNQPLRQGVIRFVPTNGTEGPKTSVLITQGKFSAEAENGPIVGTHRIEIESTDTAGLAIDDEDALARLQSGPPQPFEVVEVPASYNRQSTLTKTVTAEGPNSYEFSLSSTSGQ
jgi:hypothetical protein